MRTTLFLWPLMVWMSSHAQAQTPPDAGALMRQAEQMLRANSNAPRRDALPPPMELNAHTRIEVKRIKFSGNKHVSSDQLQALAAPFENQTLDQSALSQLTQAVTQRYQQLGWAANVYVPRQHLPSEELILQVIEAAPSSRAP